MTTRNLLAMALVSAALLLAGCGSGTESKTGGESKTEAEPKGTAESPPAPAVDAAVGQVRAFISEKGPDKAKANWRTELSMPPRLSFTPGKSYVWNLKTNKGALRIGLLPGSAPYHVSNLIYLTELGFYDGLTFHRVIPGFMAQGGDPLGNGMGDPGYKFDAEIDPALRHDAIGVLSTANAGPNTDGSQFFITFRSTPSLDGSYSIFGRVTEGLDVLQALERAGSPSGTPKDPLLIESATISVE